MDKNTALQKVANYCASGEKCCDDVFKKLTTWNIQHNEIEDIIDYLINEKFIDEQRFANAFVNDKLKFNKWGRKKISYMLSSKRIDSQIIYKALMKIDDELYIKILKELLFKKKQSIKEADEYKLKAKLINFAVSRGFEIELANNALKRNIVY